jgi:uncharacterized protein
VPLLTNRLAQVQVHALWTLRQLDALPEKGLANALTNSAHLFVHRAALRLTEDLPGPLSTNLAKAVFRQFKDVDERTRLLGLLALSHSAAETNVQQTALRMYPDLKDPYCRAVVLALARQAPMEYLKAAFASDKSEHYRELATPLVERFAQNQKTNEAAEVVRLAADHLKDAEKLTVAVLQTLGKHMGPEFEPAWSPELEHSIKKIFTAKSRTVQLANLPLATHWPRNLTLMAEAEKARDAILAELKNPKLKDEDRIALVTNLFSVTWLRPQLLSELEAMLGPGFPPPVQKQIITELARMPEKEAGAILIRKYALFTGELRPVLFAAVLKYPEWALGLLEAIGRKEIPVKDLDVPGINRLRTYPDRAVVEKAIAVFDAVGGAPKKDRAAVALGLQAVLNRPGKADLGRPIYRQHCLGCHKFPGHAPVPDWSIDLTAATILGPASLLDRVLDPNRAASPRWLAWNASTTNGGRSFGMLARDTKDSVVIRDVEGDHEIKRADLAATNCTGVSFMPEGYEMVGEENLRNLLAYLMGKTSNGFQIISLTNAFTADSRRSLFGDPTNKPEIEFKRFGMVMVASNTIPFHLVPPAGTPKGCNLVVLKGGAAQHLPQQVEVPVNTKARELHVLGGVAGWGYPLGETNLHALPAAKLTLYYADAETEEIVLKNGDQFADFVRQIDVPGSQYAPDLLVGGQLRWFTVEPKRRTKIDKLTIESFNNPLAPVFVALTAQQ